jgi:hypothetical protein
MLWLKKPFQKIITNANAFYHRYLLMLAAVSILFLRKRIPSSLLFFFVLSTSLITLSNLLLETQPRYLFMFLPMLAVLGAMMLKRREEYIS